MSESAWVNILIAAVMLLAGVVGYLYNQITELRVSVAGQFHTKAEIEGLLNKALEPVNRELEDIKRILYLRIEHDPQFQRGRTPPIQP